jgi:hypothetical protein
VRSRTVAAQNTDVPGQINVSEASALASGFGNRHLDLIQILGKPSYNAKLAILRRWRFLCPIQLSRFYDSHEAAEHAVAKLSAASFDIKRFPSLERTTILRKTWSAITQPATG